MSFWAARVTVAIKIQNRRIRAARVTTFQGSDALCVHILKSYITVGSTFFDHGAPKCLTEIFSNTCEDFSHKSCFRNMNLEQNFKKAQSLMGERIIGILSPMEVR